MRKAGTELLVIIPHPGHGHLISTLEFTNTLLRRDPRFSAAIMVINPPFSDACAYAQILSASNPHVTFVDIPRFDPSQLLLTDRFMNGEKFHSLYLESHARSVREAVGKLVETGRVNSTRFIIDMFSTSMIDVAKHFKSPTYTFFTSSASFLGFTQFILTRSPETEFVVSSEEDFLMIPSYSNPLPSSVLPTFALAKDGLSTFIHHGNRIRETQGVIVNTFAELEPHALSSFLKDNEFPPVYPVGPILDLEGMNQLISGARKTETDRILGWLDEQSKESVVFLCFGSKGYFGAEQVKEISIALENSGVTFLWSLRKSVEGATRHKVAVDYEGSEDPILPQGFLSRIGTRGLVCGWVPQVEVLAHKAIGGFITHCGWNSILESVWFGVPMATWPLYAEQQLDAFDIVKNLELGIDLKMDYRLDQSEVVRAELIEKVIKCLMGGAGEVRKRVKDMAEKSRAAVAEGGSSFIAISQLIHDMLDK